MEAGFSGAAGHLSARATVADATAWIDGNVARLAPETVGLAEATGRVLAQDAVAASDFPPFDRAVVDGLALRADETAGASAYNPLSFRLAAAESAALPSNGAILLSAGDRLPGGADAVIAIEHVQQDSPGSCEIIDAVAAGSGIEPRGSQFGQGATLLGAGRLVHPHDIGRLAAAGVSHVPVTRKPRINCFVLAPTNVPDANGLLLRALLERDGGTVAELRQIARDRAAVAQALAAAEADVVIVTGGTGRGNADEAAAALAEAGDLAIHGVALHPGETAGLGRTRLGAPAFLLPGSPAACLWAYEFLAGRAVRRLAGRDPALPFPVREMTTARKIVSCIGMTEICLVRRLSDDRVEPIAAAAPGIATTAQADGFVVISEGSEGVPEGALVTVHLYDESDRPPSHRETDRKP